MMLTESFLNAVETCPGFCRDAFVAAHEGPPVISVRMNPLKLDDLQGVFDPVVKTEGVPWCKDGHYLNARPVFTLDPLFHAGSYYVQEASSMFIHHMLSSVLGDSRGLKALDLCAAPGGKTTLLASLPHFKMILANEIIQSRVSVLQENVIKWGAHHVLVSNNDPADFHQLPGYFDCVLVDAPCSGSGLFRKDAQALKEWSSEAVGFCASRQKRILAAATAAVASGGYLLYSTCSFSKEENEDNLDFLMQMGCFESVEVGLPLDWGVVHTVSDTAGAHGYRFYPDQVKGEGFFCALLRKTATEQTQVHSRQEKMQAFTDRSLLEAWTGEQANRLLFFTRENDIYAIEEDIISDMLELKGFLRLRKSGLRMGSLKGSDFIPDHELAMGALVSSSFPDLELDLERALDYLRKNSLSVEGVAHGWRLVKYRNVALGWAKLVQGKIKNHYPLSWRILMK